MKINLNILCVIFCSLLISEEDIFPIKEYKENGAIDALITNNTESKYLIQIDVINDSLLNRVTNVLPNLEFDGGPSSYHRFLYQNDFNRLKDVLTKDYYKVLKENYTEPESRDYWAITLQGNQYNSTSGETSNSCMCIDSSDCVVVGYNDSWYNPFDYYGEVSWGFNPPEYNEILEIRVSVSGAQCDSFPLSSETDLSIKEDDCSWSDFQVTLSESYTVNGPYVITDDLVNQIWCDGILQPVIESEDNYNVDWIQVEIYYTCQEENSPQDFFASNNECDYVNLSWLNDINTSGYNLYRDGEFVISFDSSENQYLDYFANDNVEHEYCLAALNGCGESEYNCIFGNKKFSPEQIEFISASENYPSYVLVTWDPSENTDFYYLYRDDSLLNIIPNTTELFYEDIIAEQGIIYEYCIQSVNDCDESELLCDAGSLAIGNVGDVNLDQDIDVLDIVLLLNFLLEVEYPTDDQFWLSDLNQDEILNILDIVILVGLILDR